MGGRRRDRMRRLDRSWRGRWQRSRGTLPSVGAVVDRGRGRTGNGDPRRGAGCGAGGGPWRGP